MLTPATAGEDAARPDVSVVVTVFNEARNVDELVERLSTALTAWGRPWEVVLVDDGSTDGSRALLRAAHERDARLQVVLLKRNFGQHPAMAAGMIHARAGIVVTMDGDLQNDPDDIGKLIAAVEDNGVDVASGRRQARADALMSRKLPSRAINGMLRKLTSVEISDYGCAFNAYRRSAIEPVLHRIGRQKFTKALILSGGASVVEVDVGHAARHGHSRYSPLRLTRLALHVVAGFWPQPIQWAGVALGVVCTLAATGLGIYGVIFWIGESNFPGPLFGGVAILGVLGVQGSVLALVGEYLGRIQREVEGRPLYTVDREL